MAVTISDVAKAAGVGRATVCRALRNSPDVRPDTRERIRKIAADMNYRPNHIARSLVLGRSDMVAFVSTLDVTSLIDLIIGPIEAALRKAGYSLMFYTTSGRADDELACLEQVMQNRVAGVIVHASSKVPDVAAYQAVVDAGIKMVVLDRYIEGLAVPQIISDNYSTARLQTEHLISLGHKQIAYLMVPTTIYSGRERFRGFQDAMNNAGIPIDPKMLVGVEFSEEAGARAMAKLLARGIKPTGVVARHDIVAAGAMEAALDAGLSVPGDISIIGNGDMWFCKLLKVPLTTIAQPIEKAAKQAVNTLIDMLADKEVKPGMGKPLGVSVIVRSSCAPPK